MKKLLLGLGAIGTAMTPVVAVVACGDDAKSETASKPVAEKPKEDEKAKGEDAKAKGDSSKKDDKKDEKGNVEKTEKEKKAEADKKAKEAKKDEAEKKAEADRKAKEAAEKKMIEEADKAIDEAVKNKALPNIVTGKEKDTAANINTGDLEIANTGAGNKEVKFTIASVKSSTNKADGTTVTVVVEVSSDVAGSKTGANYTVDVPGFKSKTQYDQEKEEAIKNGELDKVNKAIENVVQKSIKPTLKAQSKTKTASDISASDFEAIADETQDGKTISLKVTEVVKSDKKADGTTVTVTVEVSSSVLPSATAKTYDVEVDGLKSEADKMAEELGQAKKDAKTDLETKINNLNDTLTSLTGDVVTTGKDAWEGIKKVVDDAINEAEDVDQVGTVKTAQEKVIDNAFKVYNDAIKQSNADKVAADKLAADQKVAQELSDAKTAAKAELETKINDLKDTLTSLTGDAVTTGKDAWKGIKKVVDDAIENAKDANEVGTVKTAQAAAIDNAFKVYDDAIKQSNAAKVAKELSDAKKDAIDALNEIIDDKTPTTLVDGATEPAEKAAWNGIKIKVKGEIEKAKTVEKVNEIKTVQETAINDAFTAYENAIKDANKKATPAAADAS